MSQATPSTDKPNPPKYPFVILRHTGDVGTEWQPIDPTQGYRKKDAATRAADALNVADGGPYKVDRVPYVEGMRIVDDPPEAL